MLKITYISKNIWFGIYKYSKGHIDKKISVLTKGVWKTKQKIKGHHNKDIFIKILSHSQHPAVV